jgi:hypothetical protein
LDFESHVQSGLDHFVSVPAHESSVFVGKAEVLFAHVSEMNVFLVRTSWKLETDLSVEFGAFFGPCGKEGDLGDP